MLAFWAVSFPIPGLPHHLTHFHWALGHCFGLGLWGVYHSSLLQTSPCPQGAETEKSCGTDPNLPMMLHQVSNLPTVPAPAAVETRLLTQCEWQQLLKVSPPADL